MFEQRWILPGLIANALIYGTTLFAPIFAWPATKHLITRRRAKRGLCIKCKYPRTGLAPTAPCPECGTHVTIKPRSLAPPVKPP